MPKAWAWMPLPIPPIYFHLPEHAIARYWNAMSEAAPNKSS